MTELFNAIANKVDDPCWLVSLAVVALAWHAIRSAHIGAKEEGRRAENMLRVALGKEKEVKNV